MKNAHIVLLVLSITCGGLFCQGTIWKEHLLPSIINSVYRFIKSWFLGLVLRAKTMRRERKFNLDLVLLEALAQGNTSMIDAFTSTMENSAFDVNYVPLVISSQNHCKSPEDIVYTFAKLSFSLPGFFLAG